MIEQFGHPPGQPPAALRALIGEYGVGNDLMTLYEAGGRLHADGRDLHRIPLRWEGPLLYTADESLGQEKTRFKFYLNADEECRAVSVSGAEWLRRDVGAEAIDSIRSNLRADPAALKAAALAMSPPAERTPRKPMDLVPLLPIHPHIRVDIRYASADNFMGFALYEQAAAFLQRPAAVALGEVARSVQSAGYGLLVYDAYRPWFVTKMFWDATPPESRPFVADPAKGSCHNRGCAVDLTLYDIATGQAQEMTSRYDDMSRCSHRDYVGGTSRQRWLREFLCRAMERQGFAGHPKEWWHFDYGGWQHYGIGNLPFGDLRPRADV